MKNSFISAKLISMNRISVMMMTMMLEKKDTIFYLTKDNDYPKKLKLIRHTSTNNLNIYELEMDEPFEFGARYDLSLESYPSIAIDVSLATTFPEFDQMFNYDGDDLGALYKRSETKFSVWAPLSYTVYLKIENEDGTFSFHRMNRTNRGVYRLTLQGDYLNRKYHYVVNNYTVTKESNDPYGKGVSLNSLYSAVVNTDKIRKMAKYAPKEVLTKYTDHIIYELHTRDFTAQKSTNIVNRGKFLGLTEEKRTTLYGKPAGLDYLKFIGITTVQLLPVLDFQGVDDLNPDATYNWGYDPISMFAIEGSYSLNPANPMERLIELRKVVDTFHKNNLYVTFDIVFNHVYDYMTSAFEKIVPNYFFRRRKSGFISSSSGCGNDFASEKFMARKAIIDSLLYLIETFDVDGYRFDLMGLIDIDTINMAYEKCRQLKNNVIFYGEGWDMGNELASDQKASIGNSFQMPHIAFFNDSYRDIVKGPTFEGSDLYVKGYIGGNLSYSDGVKYAMLATAVNHIFPKRFLDATQSINYVECHDNHTLYDKLTFSNQEDNEETLLSRVKFANSILTLSFGIPFYHMGQEIGLSKFGLGNTYNIVKVNNMNWKLVEERFDMVLAFKALNDLRKKLPFLHLTDMEEVKNIMNFTCLDNGLLILSSEDSRIVGKYKKAFIIFNPNNHTITHEFDDYYKVYFYNGGFIDKDDMHAKNLILPPLSMSIIYR